MKRIKLKNIIQEADINYDTEKSWQIKEKRPIKVKVKSAGNHYRIIVPPMSMKYDTFQDLDDYGGESNVSTSSYDYEDGSSVFLADSIDDIKKWLNKFKKIVKV